MNRVTITLSTRRYQALQEAAARCNKTISELIEERLNGDDHDALPSAAELVRRARGHANLDDHEAQRVAQEAVAVVRRGT